MLCHQKTCRQTLKSTLNLVQYWTKRIISRTKEKRNTIQELSHFALFRNSKTAELCFATLEKIAAWAFETAETLEYLSRVGVGAEVS